MTIYSYNRRRAVQYAEKWAYGRNPLFHNFTGIGGDCSNYVSQCIFAGCCTMNFTPVFGWYYLSLEDRAAAWTGVQYLYNFLTSHSGDGPIGMESNVDSLNLGDIIQFGDDAGYYFHSVVITGGSANDWLVSAHSLDAYNRPLSSYTHPRTRGIRIIGYRADAPLCPCFAPLYGGSRLVTCHYEASPQK